jgi:hypothetical protein
MIIPVGPPGAQRILRVVKDQAPDGTFTIARSVIYNGRVVPFVPSPSLRAIWSRAYLPVTVSASAGSMKAASERQMRDERTHRLNS